MTTKVATQTVLAQLRQLEAAATPAPWSWRKDQLIGPVQVDGYGLSERKLIVEPSSYLYSPDENDRALIVAMRNSLSQVLSTVDSLSKALDEEKEKRQDAELRASELLLLLG